MSNNKQSSSIEWFAQQLYETLEIKGDGYVIDSLLDLAKAMHKEEMQTEYQDGRESVIIEHTAALSTSNASSYSDGYNKGYMTALQYIKFVVDDRIKTITI
jgi:hypothetical protein